MRTQIRPANYKIEVGLLRGFGLRCFAYDVPALTAAKMCGVNKNTTHQL